jgi:hypothetical protein
VRGINAYALFVLVRLLMRWWTKDGAAGVLRTAGRLGFDGAVLLLAADPRGSGFEIALRYSKTLAGMSIRYSPYPEKSRMTLNCRVFSWRALLSRPDSLL